MHLLISVFFNVPQGGLHENVRATAFFMLSNQHRVTVVCRPGSFAEELRHTGIGVIETDYAEHCFAKALSEVRALHERHPIDLIHVHPSVSRRLGLIAAEVLGLPCVATLHGKYLDALPQTIDKLDAVFTVSEGIRHYLLTEGGVAHPEKLYVVPNTPDTKMFRAVKLEPLTGAQGRVVISLVTRLDQDKSFILDVFYHAVAHATEHYPRRIHWQVVGQGMLLERFAERVEALRGENTVSYTGWLQGEALRDAYCQSDAVIAPGRCTLEAMSCGVPAIALGSKGYNGLVDNETWQQAVFTNFGGVGDRHESYTLGAVERDLDTLMTGANVRGLLGSFGRCIVQQQFNASVANQSLLGLYELVLEANRICPREPVPEEMFLELRLRRLEISRPQPNLLMIELECERVETLSFAWYLIKNGETIEKMMYEPEPRRGITLPGDGNYQVRCFVQDDKGRKISFIGASVTLDDDARLQHALCPSRSVSGWSGDGISAKVLLKLHQHLRTTRPNVVVELNCSIATLVITDALRQNGVGKLVSFSDDPHRISRVQEMLDESALLPWVEFRSFGTCLAEGSMPPIAGIEGVALIWSDAAPKFASQHDYLELLSAIVSRAVSEAELWTDPRFSKNAQALCARWAKRQGEDESLECLIEGLSVLRLTGGHCMLEVELEELKGRCKALVEEHARTRGELAEQVSRLQEENGQLKQQLELLECPADTALASIPRYIEDDVRPECALGLDFSLPDEGRG